MKVAELQGKSQAELQKQLAELRTQLTEQTRSLRAGELSNTRAIKETRRDIARVMTVINAPSADEEKE